MRRRANHRPLVAPDGTRRGQQIPGSRFVRDFCWGCGSPIRVLAVGDYTLSACSQCDHQPPGHRAPPQAMNDHDSGGYGPIAQRKLEDAGQ